MFIYWYWIGKVCTLRWEDINFINNTISIKRTSQRISNINGNSLKKTKIIVTTPKSTNSIRTIPVNSSIMSILKDNYANNNYYILTGSNTPKDTRVYEKLIFIHCVILLLLDALNQELMWNLLVKYLVTLIAQ